ncbi:MAG: DUF7088 domain-containing protein [Planctomycetota bacterium]|jgi:hypothetical protein
MSGQATEPESGVPQPLAGLNLGLFLVGILTIAVVVNFFAERPWLRLRLDATKTRAYSLSDQTGRLLADLDGDWTIAVVVSPDGVEPAVLRQVTEVLDRYREASESISVVRVDPTDPRTLDEYEALLDRLQVIYRDRISQYEQDLERGREAVASFAVFCQQQAGRLQTLRQGVAPDDPARREIDETLGVLGLRLQQVEKVDQERERALRVDESRPLPDYEMARSVLAAALASWADELYRIVQMFGRWRDDAEVDPAVREFSSTWRDEYDRRARALALVADPLKHLPTLELAGIGRQLEQGEAAVVIGPPGAAVIPSTQLFPRLNLRRGGSGQVTFDQRFGGEQAISAAIRSLLVEHMPMVVFVHAQGESMLRRRARNVDLLGAMTVLEASRFEVEEWNVGQGDKPAPVVGQPVVWIVVPPPIPERRSLALTDAESALIDAVGELVDGGEPVLLSLCPSLLHQTQPDDPWQELARPLGIEVDTARVVYERIRDRQGAAVNQRVLQLMHFEPGHAIAAATHGLRTSFDLPLAVRPAETVPPGVELTVIAAVAPEANRWLEEDWFLDPAVIDEPTAQQQFDRPLPLVVAVERRHPLEHARQRCLVLGSGGWLLSYMADVVFSVGGDRVVLLNPGNYELLLAGIAWLAGADELIASSPLSQQVARLDGITPAVVRLWRWIAVAGVPGGCLLLGVVVWWVRRS